MQFDFEIKDNVYFIEKEQVLTDELLTLLFIISTSNAIVLDDVLIAIELIRCHFGKNYFLLEFKKLSE